MPEIGRRGAHRRREIATRADGIVTLRPTGPGGWHLTFSRIRQVTASDDNYESHWATITFQLR